MTTSPYPSLVAPVAPRRATRAQAQADPWDDLIEEYLNGLASANRSPRTVETYRYALASLRRHLGPGVGIEGVTALDLSRWLASRPTPANRAFMYRSAKPAFSWAVRIGVIEANPFSRLPAPKVPHKVLAIPTSDDVRAVLATCATNGWLDRRDRAMIRVLLDAGLRRGELASLRVSDIDIAIGIIHVRSGKTGARIAPLGQRSRQEIRAWLRARQQYLIRNGLSDSGALFINRKGQPLVGNHLYRAVARRLKAASVRTPRAVHAFRHFWASTSLANGAGELEVQVIGGWTGLAMVSRYAQSGKVERALHGHAQRWGPGDRL